MSELELLAEELERRAASISAVAERMSDECSMSSLSGKAEGLSLAATVARERATETDNA